MIIYSRGYIYFIFFLGERPPHAFIFMCAREFEKPVRVNQSSRYNIKYNTYQACISLYYILYFYRSDLNTFFLSNDARF